MLALLVIAALAQTQEPPTVITTSMTVIFDCAPALHAKDTGHELDLLDPEGRVVQTIELGDPAPDEKGEIVVKLNVLPERGVVYTAVVRATIGKDKTASSAPSKPFIRK